jgi:hypothetical protein
MGRALTALAALATALAPGCDEEQTRKRTAASVRTVPTVDCSDAITDPVDRRWRSKSIVRGPLGVYGTTPHVASAQPWGRRAFLTKVPFVVAGRVPVTVRVAVRDRARVGLLYGARRQVFDGPANGARALATAPRALRLSPCSDRRLTAWPGELVLRDRSAVHLSVEVKGEPRRKLRLG